MDELATGTDANISNTVIQRYIQGPRNEKDSIPPSQGLEKASPLRPFMEPQDISSDIPVAERYYKGMSLGWAKKQVEFWTCRKRRGLRCKKDRFRFYQRILKEDGKQTRRTSQAKSMEGKKNIKDETFYRSEDARD